MMSITTLAATWMARAWSTFASTMRLEARPRARLSVAASLLVSGCNHSPSQDILGSYFPSWLLCLGIGFLAAVAARLVVGWVGFRDDIPVPLATYLALAFATTCLLWLLWFGH